ncbi:MAG: rhamnan synthesis F family protein [Betaproteobacteria bacterium]
MTLATAANVPARDRVVLAWEPAESADDDSRLAALPLLASCARQSDAALLLSIDAKTESLWGRILAILAHCPVEILPMIVADRTSGALSLPSGTATMLRSLAVAGTLVDWDRVRYAGVSAGPDFGYVAARAAIGVALGQPETELRIGWVRQPSPHMSLPPGVDFAFDWPPYGAASAGTGIPLANDDYSLVVAEIARCHAENSPVAPSVPWSSLPVIASAGMAHRLTLVSALKIAHAIDSARRFVRNRARHGIPFWVLRIALDPDHPEQVAAMSGVPAAMAAPHAPSGPLSGAGRITPPSRSVARIAAVLHLYYPELWEEFADAIADLPEACDVFVSCQLRARDAVAGMVRKRFPDAVVFGIHNLGRDVLPFLHWLAMPGVERYQYVLKLHSKKSVHVLDAAQSPFGGGDTWRRQALGGLVGSPDHARAMLQALDARPEVGLVAPAGLLYDQVAWRCATADLVATLCDGFGITARVSGSFPAGTMFWARLAALVPLVRTPARLLDFEREAGQVDGTLHHSYERLFPLVAAALGFQTVDSTALVP